jgi:hypothetical protein
MLFRNLCKNSVSNNGRSPKGPHTVQQATIRSSAVTSHSTALGVHSTPGMVAPRIPRWMVLSNGFRLRGPLQSIIPIQYQFLLAKSSSPLCDRLWLTQLSLLSRSLCDGAVRAPLIHKTGLPFCTCVKTTPVACSLPLAPHSLALVLRPRRERAR